MLIRRNPNFTPNSKSLVLEPRSFLAVAGLEDAADAAYGGDLDVHVNVEHGRTSDSLHLDVLVEHHEVRVLLLEVADFVQLAVFLLGEELFHAFQETHIGSGGSSFTKPGNPKCSKSLNGVPKINRSLNRFLIDVLEIGLNLCVNMFILL